MCVRSPFNTCPSAVASKELLLHVSSLLLTPETAESPPAWQQAEVGGGQCGVKQSGVGVCLTCWSHHCARTAAFVIATGLRPEQHCEAVSGLCLSKDSAVGYGR